MPEDSQTEKHISWLEDLKEAGDEEAVEALDAAQDALAFSQALWDLFADQLLHEDGPDPDLNKMENIIDALNGELAAAVLFLNSISGDVPGALRKNADLLDKMKADGHPGASTVPQVVILGNRRLAKRVENTAIVLAAQQTEKVTK